MRVTPSSRSPALASASAITRAMMPPTVAQPTRRYVANAVLDIRVANHATRSSNARVCPAPCRAHGTAATVTPCCGQRTRGAAASSNAAHNPDIERAPPPHSTTPVIARTPPPTLPTPAPPPRRGPHRHHHRTRRAHRGDPALQTHDRLEPHRLDHHLLDPEQPSPYPL